MNENEFLIELLAKLDEEASKGRINSDIDTIRNNIKELQVQASIDPKAVEKIRKQIEAINGQKITISNIDIDSNNAIKNAEQSGKKMGSSINKSIRSSINSIKNDIENVVKSVERFDASNLIKSLNLDRSSVSKSTLNQIRLLASEMSSLREEVIKTGSDSSWEKLYEKANTLSKICKKLGKEIDLSAKEGAQSLVDYFSGKNIFTGDRSSGLSGMDVTVGKLRKELKSLGVSFSDVKQETIELNSIWEEMCQTTGRMELLDISNDQDQLQTIIRELRKAKSILYGEEGLVEHSNPYGDITKYIDSIEAARKTVVQLQSELASTMQRLSQTSDSTTDNIIKNEERKQDSYKETLDKIKSLDSEVSIVRSGAGSVTFDSTNNAAKEAQTYFNSILRDENAIISTVEKFEDNNALSSFTVNVKRASGEVESLRYSLTELKDENGGIGESFFKLSESSIGDAGAKKLLQNIDNAFADYTAKIAQFKNTNKEILSGLSVPIENFENQLEGLKTGATTIDDVRNSFKLLNAEASNITSNFTGQLSKIDAAVRNISKGEDTLSGLRAEFKGLNNSPKNINSELNRLSESLQRIKDIESSEGRTANWSKAYREWEISVDNLKAKLIALKKEQSNVASTEIFKTSDLRKNDIAYMTKVSNTINRQMAEIEKMAHAKGWTDFDVTGIEEADGKIKALVMTVTDAEGAIKKLNFQRAKLAGNGKAQDGLMQVGDVQILKTAAKAQEELAAKTQKSNAEFEKQAGKISQSLSNGDYDKKLKVLINSYEKLGLTSEEVKTKTNEVSLALDKLKEKNLDTLIQDEDNFTNALKKAQNEAVILKTDLDNIYNPKRQTKLSNDIQNWLHKNSNASKDAKASLNEYYRELSSGRVSVNRLEYIEKELKSIDTTQRSLGKLGKNIIDQFADAGKNLGQWLSISSGIMTVVSKTKDAISELKNLDSILTEISKTSDLTNNELKKLGDSAFNSASKYGKNASDYLTGVQEMYRAGFSNAQQMSELSILAQAAGDMDAATANDYLIASDAAYELKGNVEALNAVLDGQNMITNNAAVSMLDMAQATSEAASIASQYGVKIDELSSLIAVATSKTRESGSETGTALKALFVNLQDTTSKPIREAFDAVNISMTEMVNGSEKLKTPIQLLKELSDAFVSLSDGDVKRANILSDIGGKHHANTLSAILSDWQSYEKMLELYSNGIGSAAKEAEKSANNWEGSLARLSNTWTSTINNIVNSDAVVTGVNGLNKILSVIDNITDRLGSMGTIGLGAGLFAGIKNIGKCRMSVRISNTVFCFEYALHA